MLPENLSIETPFDWKLYSPLEVELLEVLQKRGIEISIRPVTQKENNALAKIISVLETESEKSISIDKDDSFNILHFEEQDDALRYLSLMNPETYDAWINSDNKELDNWLFLEGKPVSGS